MGEQVLSAGRNERFGPHFPRKATANQKAAARCNLGFGLPDAPRATRDRRILYIASLAAFRAAANTAREQIDREHMLAREQLETAAQ
jgi:hypothetical protein